MIKALIFDVFGVLYPDTYNEFVAKHAERLSPADQDYLYNLHTQSNRGLIDIRAAVEQMAKLVDLKPVEIYTELYEKEPVNTDLIELIAGLKPRYKIGILSNVGDGFIENFFVRYGLAHYFDAVTLSCRIGFVKPQKESYHLAAEALGVPPGSCLMIDDKQRNIDGASTVGMPGLLYDNFPQFQRELKATLETS